MVQQKLSPGGLEKIEQFKSRLGADDRAGMNAQSGIFPAEARGRRERFARMLEFSAG